MSLKTAPIYRIKFAADRTGEISGYGSVVGNVDSYGEIVERGAFAKSLAKHRKDGTAPLMLWQHYADQPIGRWTDAEEDSTGLFLTGKLNLETSWGKDAWAAAENGDVNGLSIGYREVTSRPDGLYRRLEELDLLEVSLVSFPANPKARVHLNGKRDLEELLLKSGLPKGAAAKIVAGGWPALSPGDTADDADLGSLLAALKHSSQTARK